MRYTVNITSNGRVVTIPKAVREKIGLTPGTKVTIYPTSAGFIGEIQRRSRRSSSKIKKHTPRTPRFV